jgi:hypothetical protein
MIIRSARRAMTGWTGPNLREAQRKRRGALVDPASVRGIDQERIERDELDAERGLRA